jgi:hypothetical protein
LQGRRFFAVFNGSAPQKRVTDDPDADDRKPALAEPATSIFSV